MSHDEEWSPGLCPLCGRDNRCALVAGKGTCWCYTLVIPEEVLEQIPEGAVGVACVCESCVRGRPNPRRKLAVIAELLRRR